MLPINAASQESLLSKVRSKCSALLSEIKLLPESINVTFQGQSSARSKKYRGSLESVVFKSAESLNLKDFRKNEANTSIIKFHQVLADSSGLSLDEVFALSENFHFNSRANSWFDKPILDGSMGIFGLEKEYLANHEYGVIAAYKIALEKLRPGLITVEDILEIANAALSKRAILDGSQVIDIPFCLLYTSPSPRDATLSRMPSSA